MNKEYAINGYGEHPYYCEIIDYILDPQQWVLEIKYVSDTPSKEDIIKYLQEAHPLLYKKGIKHIEYNKILRNNQKFKNYYIINVKF
jgi:hypothetical protein